MILNAKKSGFYSWEPRMFEQGIGMQEIKGTESGIWGLRAVVTRCRKPQG